MVARVFVLCGNSNRGVASDCSTTKETCTLALTVRELPDVQPF